jgi:acyl-CoA dehydrogenase
VFARHDLPNIGIFRDQIDVLKEMLVEAAPDEAQTRDTDFLLALGEIFTLIVYGQLFLENAEIYEIESDLIDQVFDVFVRDFARFATQLHGKASTSKDQAEFCMRMIRRPAEDPERTNRVWITHVHARRDTYEMRP